MADMLESIDNLPDISFIDDLTLTDVQALLLNAFYDNYKQITGKRITLARADPYRVMMLSAAQIIYQGLQQVDKAGKMNFLKYAYGDYLKNLAALKKVTAKEPEKAQVQVRWKLAGPREAATPIPAGSRITADYAVYFETADYAEIPAGDTEITLMMYCTEAGEQGNGYMAGELSVLVDPVAFIESVANIETTAKGTGDESDQSIAERTYLAPSSFSTAGPDDAYIYHAKKLQPGDRRRFTDFADSGRSGYTLYIKRRLHPKRDHDRRDGRASAAEKQEAAYGPGTGCGSGRCKLQRRFYLLHKYQRHEQRDADPDPGAAGRQRLPVMAEYRNRPGRKPRRAYGLP